MAIDGFSHINAPLRPAVGGAIDARRLHGRSIVGVAGDAGSQPGHDDMAIGVSRDPREDVGLANRSVPVDADRRRPGVAQIRGRREKDILVVGPDGIDVAEVVDGDGGKNVVASVHRSG